MRIVSAALALLLMAICVPALAQKRPSYPEKPVRVVVPLAPGGATDILARVLGQRLSRELGKQFVVDNRPGAGGTIAYGIVARAPADGYTLLAVASDFTMTPSLYSNLPYDPITSFAPIALVSESPFLLLVHPSVAVNSTRELLELARAKPGSLNFASGGQGSSLHVALELFKLMAKVSIVHVPYKGGGPALEATVGGQVNGTFANSVSALPHVRSGRLKPLAVTSAKRSEVLPDLPTVTESGVPGYITTAWHGWLAPQGTPPHIVNGLSLELARIVTAAEMTNRLAADAGKPIGSSPDQFKRHIASELSSFAKVIKEGGIRVD